MYVEINNLDQIWLLLTQSEDSVTLEKKEGGLSCRFYLIFNFFSWETLLLQVRMQLFNFPRSFYPKQF